MPEVKFYLKKPQPVTGKSLIYLQFKYHSQRLVFSFGQTINPDSWNLKKQRVKSNKHTTDDGQYSLNDLLDNLEKVCLKAYNAELASGVPTPDSIKAQLIYFMNQKKT